MLKSPVPTATYRLQFHRDFTLRQALKRVPYLSALGVSHVYASPLLKACPGSTHGYDVCDPTQINPEIGSEADLEAFVSALRERGMGLVLDIVPNHMAAAPENPWWWDVLKRGRASRFARTFDIDWDSPDPRLRDKVLVPVLGDELDRVLERGELKMAQENGEVTVRYFEQQFPASPESLPALGELREEALAEFASDRQAVARFLEQQHYRLAFWRHGDTQLNYRRFFTLSSLAGVRVELPEIFAETHRRILAWHERGLIDGLRVDHPDGLRDPQRYLQRLNQAAPGVWLVVEKILEPGESLPAGWPVAGTTGYDFLNRVGQLFIDPAGEKPLTAFYAQFTGEPTDWAALVREKKRWILRHGLAAEVARLARLLSGLIAGQTRRASFEQSREAVVEMASCFPVYRTYVEAEGDHKESLQDEHLPAPQDIAQIRYGVAAAQRERPDLAATLDYLGDLLSLRARGGESAELVMRFQQLTGPAMAKGVEDTACYCFNRFVALNEVGGDPARFGVTVQEFHAASSQAREQWPTTLLATSTHDTKRSEDARARLALLSEIPDRWAETVRRWSAMGERHRRNGWPDRNAEYLFYQSLVGTWPLPLERAVAYMEKAAREANQHTNWIDRNAAYEATLRDFVTGTLSDPSFVEAVERFVKPLVRPGQVNSLAQTLLKLTTPGVPDIYQGTEMWDFSLVDPDNRRPVDFAQRRDALVEMQRRLEDGGVRALVDDLLRSRDDGRIKLFVIRQTLQFRRQHEQLFGAGHYLPLSVLGSQAEHVCAFARTLNDMTAVTVVPRLVLGLAAGRDDPRIRDEIWEDTRLHLPWARRAGPFRNVFTGELLDPDADRTGDSLRIADILRDFPVALLATVET